MLPALKNGRGLLRSLFGFNQRTFGGFLFQRSALLRRISGGFTHQACTALGLATEERYTKTCDLYPRSQKRSLTAHLVKARHLRNLKAMPGVLSDDLLPQGRGLLQAALSSQVNRPHHLDREAQSDGVLIVAPFPAVHHLSPHGDLIEHRSDFREFPRLPGMIADDTCAVRAHIDRKSSRLNSSHGYISYAVFCLKKKKQPQHLTST